MKTRKPTYQTHWQPFYAKPQPDVLAEIVIYTGVRGDTDMVRHQEIVRWFPNTEEYVRRVATAIRNEHGVDVSYIIRHFSAVQLQEVTGAVEMNFFGEGI